MQYLVNLWAENSTAVGMVSAVYLLWAMLPPTVQNPVRSVLLIKIGTAPWERK